MSERRTKPKAHQRTLTLATVGQLAGGQAEAIINAALRAALRDTEDRGADKKPRKVTIELELRKLGESISATAKAKTTLPPYLTDPTIGELTMNDRGQPEMSFSPVAPENPHQPAVPGMDD
ncbi:unnamed protein product [Gemmataceae bacterium]|nr:unnamed protein product [Gemmataceae bacterium]VTU01032.1 unnamed protein product [Gemmataceae bacterium]